MANNFGMESNMSASSEFEYQAMRAMVGDLIDLCANETKEELVRRCDLAGLTCIQSSYGIMMYPTASPRKYPACIIISSSGALPRVYSKIVCSRGIVATVCEAGNYDMAGKRKEATVRA